MIFILGPWINDNVALSQNPAGILSVSQEIEHNISMTRLWGTMQVIVVLFITIISVLKPWEKKN